jgi:hypothetical protein
LDDELHEVGIGLLPEGFLAFAEEIVEQRSNVVRERISVEVVVQRVVAVVRVQVDLDVVLFASVLLEDVLDLVAEVAQKLASGKCRLPSVACSPISSKPTSGPRGSAEGLKDYFRIADHPDGGNWKAFLAHSAVKSA